jgi:predicted amidophosphoribosyltransferase
MGHVVLLMKHVRMTDAAHQVKFVDQHVALLTKNVWLAYAVHQARSVDQFVVPMESHVRRMMREMRPVARLAKKTARGNALTHKQIHAIAVAVILNVRQGEDV